MSAEKLREAASLMREQSAENKAPVRRAHTCPDGTCVERHERAWGA